MLPINSVEQALRSGIVTVRPDRGREDTGDARTCAAAIGSKDTRGGGRAVRTGVHTYRAHQLSHRAAGGRRAEYGGNRMAGASRTRPDRQGPAPVRVRGYGRAGAAQTHWPTARSDAGLAGRTAARDR